MIDEIRKFVMLDDNTRGIVYIASNKINHKIYIGMSMQNLTKRKLEHKSISKKNSNSYFHYAIKKNGFYCLKVMIRILFLIKKSIL